MKEKQKTTIIMIIVLLTIACTSSAAITQTATPPPVPTVGAEIVQIHNSPTAQTMTVCAEILNVRAGAGTRYTVIGHLFKGDAVTIHGRTDGWVRIANTKWVNEKYLCEVKP